MFFGPIFFSGANNQLSVVTVTLTSLAGTGLEVIARVRPRV